MLAVVLVVEHHLHPAQGLLEAGTIKAGGSGTVVRPLAPTEKGLAQVCSGIPGATVDQGLQTGSVGTGGGPINAALGPALTGELSQGIQFIRFIKGRHHRLGLMHPANQLGEGVAKQPGDAQHHIHPRSTQQTGWNHLQVHHPSGGAVPNRSNTDQGQQLGNIFSAIAHRCCSPDR